jgi:hypothetical protein
MTPGITDTQEEMDHQSGLLLSCTVLYTVLIVSDLVSPTSSATMPNTRTDLRDHAPVT